MLPSKVKLRNELYCVKVHKNAWKTTFLSVQELRDDANKKSVFPSFLFFLEETVDKHSILTKAAIWIYFMHKAPLLSS